MYSDRQTGKALRTLIVIDLLTIGVGALCLFADGHAVGKLAAEQRMKEPLPGPDSDAHSEDAIPAENED